MSLITSPESAILGAAAGSHGFDDVGMEQPSGTITGATAASGYAGGRFPGKTLLTITGPTGVLAPSKGNPINITGTTSYAGVSRVLFKISDTQIIVNKTYVASETGSWDMKGGNSAWVAMMPRGADLATGSIAELTFWDEKAQGGNEKAQPYTKDQMYFFPGVIKTILLQTAGNVRLFRHSTLNPGGKATAGTAA